MNVAVLLDHFTQGGAAIAASRISDSIDSPNECWPIALSLLPNWGLNLGFLDLEIFFKSLWYEESEAKRQLYRLPRKLFPKWFPHPHTPAFAAQRLRDNLRLVRPDIINVHNLHAAAPWGWGPHLVEVCLEFAPVVWTLHDMWSFTGRCAYSYDCEKFITGCDASCPTPHENPKLEPTLIRAAWEERCAIYQRHRKDLVIVTPSQWLAKEARRGMFAQHRIKVIPYGNTRPLDYLHTVEEARRELGINPAGPVVLVAAYDLNERRKGAEVVPQLWQFIEHRPLTILTVGHGSISVNDPLIEIHALGWLDADKISLAFSAADALLHPAPVDNFPNVVLEAFACGTPAIAMPVGGLPEMVRPGVSGWLAEDATPAALGRAVDRAIRDLALDKSLRESCRSLAEKEYSMELQGRRYIELFKELLQR